MFKKSVFLGMFVDFCFLKVLLNSDESFLLPIV